MKQNNDIGTYIVFVIICYLIYKKWQNNNENFGFGSFVKKVNKKVIQPVNKEVIQPTNEKVVQPTIQPINEEVIQPTNKEVINPAQKTVTPVVSPITSAVTHSVQPQPSEPTPVVSGESPTQNDTANHTHSRKNKQDKTSGNLKKSNKKRPPLLVQM